MVKIDYLTKTELKERGWTDSIIKKMNLMPDLTKKNPYYNKAPPMKLYLHDKISDLEETEEFINLREKSLKRKESSKKAIITKTEKNMCKLKELLDNLEIYSSYNSYRELLKDAIESYNTGQNNRPSVMNGKNDGFFLTLKSDKEVLDRIVRNYMRHEETNYDYILNKIKGKVGISELYYITREKMMNKIEEYILNLKNKKR